MIEVSNIRFNYAGCKARIFDDFSLTLEQNNVYGLLGKNGTGKSTLLYLISGLLRPVRGTVKIDGVESQLRRPDVLGELFIVPEEFELPAMSLDTYVKLNESFYPHFSREVLNQCLQDFELPLAMRLDELSMGQKKKVYMSFALASGTRLLLMDEPTNGLDIPSKSQFRKVIARSMTADRTLIISTHQVHDVEQLLDHIIILDRHRLLLNASVADLCDRYVFDFCKPGEQADDVIYAEPSLQGNAIIRPRREGMEESQLNLELLFDAVACGKLQDAGK